jgi:hypothetical protein
MLTRHTVSGRGLGVLPGQNAPAFAIVLLILVLVLVPFPALFGGLITLRTDELTQIQAGEGPTDPDVLKWHATNGPAHEASWRKQRPGDEATKAT